ncbi:hypothetical protein ABW19_dt0208964 [Dactylella cylindrospora]|nr:hypothetical protein ABW19_dt0208964 [Dactylella cylindrospora]
MQPVHERSILLQIEPTYHCAAVPCELNFLDECSLSLSLSLSYLAWPGLVWFGLVWSDLVLSGLGWFSSPVNRVHPQKNWIEFELGAGAAVQDSSCSFIKRDTHARSPVPCSLLLCSALLCSALLAFQPSILNLLCSHHHHHYHPPKVVPKK